MSKNKLKMQNKSQIPNPKSQINPKSKIQILKLEIGICLVVLVLFVVLGFTLNAFAQEVFKYDAKGKRNPFIPLVTSDGRLLKLDKEQTQQDLLVEGIIYDKQGRSYAIVNGSILGIGDSIGDYQVLKIQDKKVAFIKDGIIREVEIKKEE